MRQISRYVTGIQYNNNELQLKEAWTLSEEEYRGKPTVNKGQKNKDNGGT